MKVKKHNLVDMDITDIALVDRGANKKKFFLFKSETGGHMTKETVLKLIKSDELDNEEKEALVEGFEGEDHDELVEALELHKSEEVEVEKKGSSISKANKDKEDGDEEDDKKKQRKKPKDEEEEEKKRRHKEDEKKRKDKEEEEEKQRGKDKDKYPYPKKKSEDDPEDTDIDPSEEDVQKSLDGQVREKLKSKGLNEKEIEEVLNETV